MPLSSDQINPPALRYRTPRYIGGSPRHQQRRSKHDVTTTFGVPSHWTRYLDMLLWSLRGDVEAVQAQINSHGRFDQPISIEWVQQRLGDTAFQQLAFLRMFLPGEIGTITRVKIRATVLDGGHDYFHQGPAGDDTPLPGSNEYIRPPMPDGGPYQWSRARDAFLRDAVRKRESPTEVWKKLNSLSHAHLGGLTRSWLETRMVQITFMGENSSGQEGVVKLETPVWTVESD